MLLACDIGGTSIKYGCLDENRRVVFCSSVPTQKGAGLRSQLQELINKVCSEHDVQAVSLGCPGMHSGLVIKKNVKLEVENLDLAGICALPMTLVNDATAAIFGGWQKAGRPTTPFIGVTLGTGVGGGAVVDGKLLMGASGGAAEFGHMSIESDGPVCGCGNRGCLERYIGWQNFVEQAQALGLKVHNAKELAASTDPRAQELWNWFGVKLGAGVANLIWAFNPSHVMIGGGVAGALTRFEAAMKKEIDSRLPPQWREQLAIFAVDNEETPLVGLAEVAALAPAVDKP